MARSPRLALLAADRQNQQAHMSVGIQKQGYLPMQLRGSWMG
jgi:hypothetical protein